MAVRPDLALPAEELAVLIDAIEDYAIFLLGPHGEIRSWNSGATRIMGYSAEEAVGSNFSRFYGPDDLAADKPGNELVIASREGRVYDEGWRVRKDGTRFWANTVITALRDKHNRVTGFAKITRDLTERRGGEERLRRSEEMFRLLVASVREYAIFLLDPDGNVLTWNAGAERIKGYSADEIIGKHFSRFYAKEDKWKPDRELEIARKDGSVEDEGWRLRKDGTRFWANVVITAVHDEHGELRGFTKVTRDLTERRRSEQALFEQREARFLAEEERRRAETASRVSQEANRAKDEFLMTLSHELRTPMTAILGWARLLPALPPNDDSFREAVAAIGRSAQLQSRLIDDVLDVSRIVSGKLRLSVENIDTLQLLEATIETVRPGADAKDIRIVSSFSPDIGAIVGDPTRLQQVLWNLLSNAVKFTPKNGAVHVSARRTSSHVQFAVTDTGDGIDPGFLPHVFEPFRQAENPSTRVHGGLGLGLSIVRYLAEAHGGTVAADSRGKGHGATFTVTLPIGAVTAQPAVPAAPVETEARALSDQQLTGRAILLVDDDEEGRRVFRAILKRAGAVVTDVASAAHALDSIAASRPDVVITDIAMPGTDGYALARRLHDDHPGLKIVALSAFPAGRSGAKDSVFDAYVTKPVEPADLVATIAKI
ncbi:MAG TPA: PAS domain S-box protein [Thermoanaerobaculia bacterium]|nr:PAS domain S-box protein [Thermoanaerobaculia bacterium]